jgi:hypothetical protein
VSVRHRNIAQRAADLQELMANVALHRLGLLSDAALDLSFKQNPELERGTVEMLVDDTMEEAKTLTREQLKARGDLFWRAFYLSMGGKPGGTG